MYLFVIEVADFKSDFGFNSIAIVFGDICILPSFKNSLGLPGCRVHVHLGQNLFDVFEGFEGCVGFKWLLLSVFEEIQIVINYCAS